MNDGKFWNENYWANYGNSKQDFLKDNWMNKYKDIICTSNNGKAVDLGCGLGQDSAWLAQQGFDVISCDISSVALRKLIELYPEAQTIELDIAQGLPFEDNSIDIVNANLSLHYFTMEKTIEIFEDIYRVLKKDGLLIGRVNSDKNDYVNPNSKEIEKDFYYDTKAKKHSRLFNKEQFDKLTKEWKVLVLNENETIRIGRKKYIWEFIFKK